MCVASYGVIPQAYSVARCRVAATFSSPVAVSRSRGCIPRPGRTGTSTARHASMIVRLSGRRGRGAAGGGEPGVTRRGRGRGRGGGGGGGGEGGGGAFGGGKAGGGGGTLGSKAGGWRAALACSKA